MDVAATTTSSITSAAAFKVSGKTAVVTGAGSGINLAFATLLLEGGCNVVIGDLLLRPEAQAVVDKYSKGTPRAIFARTDVTKWKDLEALFTAAESEFGAPPDIVCPGAGIFEPHWSNFWLPPGSEKSKDPVGGTADEGIGHYATLDINLIHPIRTTQLAISKWLNGAEKVSLANPKRVVHVSSIAGQHPGFAHPLYASSKHALNGFIRSLGLLEKLGIRVNGVAPGVIKTPLWTDHPEKMVMMEGQEAAWIEPEEVAIAMLSCVEDDEVGPGTVLEVLKGKTRHVGFINDPGASGLGSSATNREVLRDQVFEWLGQSGWGNPKH